MTTPHHPRGVFPIVPYTEYELVDGAIYRAFPSSEDPAGVIFLSRDGVTAYVPREGVSGGHEVTALVRRVPRPCADCGGEHWAEVPSDFVIWDFDRVHA